MSGYAVLDSGNYDLQIATGFIVDGFTLDSATKGVFDNSDFVLDGTTEFASVLESTTNIAVKRGRRDIGDQFSAGTITFNGSTGRMTQDLTSVFKPTTEIIDDYDF